MKASIYQRIVTDLKDKINSGEFKKGAKIPSIRQLSRDYACSKDTVQRALLELKYQKFVYAVEKSGYYVLEGRETESDTITLSLEDYNNKTYDDFKLCLHETLKGRENYLFNYYHSQAGLEDLLDSLKEHLLERDIYCQQEQLVVTSGSQQALYILSQLDFPNNKKTILLEQPTYYRMNAMIKEQNLPFQTITRSFNGLDLAEFEEIFKTDNIKFFYTISRYSNPLGLSYTKEEKEAILDLAERYDVYILEDDYMGDFASTQNLPLHYFDTKNRVIYLKSFSMTVFPALRLGAVVLPPTLIEPFLAYKSLIDYDTNLIMQKALSLYLSNGMFEQNLRRLEGYFQEKMQKSENILKNKSFFLDYQLSPNNIILKLSTEDYWHYHKNSFFKSLDKSFLAKNNHQYLQISHDDIKK